MTELREQFLLLLKGKNRHKQHVLEINTLNKKVINSKHDF